MSQQITISTSEQIVQVTLNESGDPIRAVLRENAIIIQKGGTRVGTVNAINFIEGNNITLTYTNDADGVTGNLTISATGGAGSAAWGGITGTLSTQTDLQTALDAKLVKASNLSDVANAATALSNLGGQPLDSDLTAIAALTTTAYGRAVLALANAAAFRTYIGASRGYLYQSNSTVNNTGNTTENYITGFLVSGNTLALADKLMFELLFSKSGTAGSAVIRIYVNDTNDISGTPTTISIITASATNIWIPIRRMIIFKNSISSQVAFTAGSTTQPSDIVFSTQAKNSLSIDFSANKYFVITVQNGSAADTTTLESVSFEIVRP